MKGFNLYQSRPIELLATQIKSGGFLEKIPFKESTYHYQHERDGVSVEFKAHQEPVAGDYICYLNENDVYHVDAKTFSERNIVDSDESKPSPDAEMEQEIVDKGLVYPRIEAAQIDELMTQVVYDVHVVPGTTTTVITAMLPMGHINFSLCTEIMACVDPRNFDAELGKKYGIEKAEKVARNKLWELEGYALAKVLTS